MSEGRELVFQPGMEVFVEKASNCPDVRALAGQFASDDRLVIGERQQKRLAGTEQYVTVYPVLEYPGQEEKPGRYIQI